MRRIKVWLRHYFGFTARESRGFLTMIGLLVAVLSFPTVYDFFNPAPPPIEATIEELEADSAVEVLEAHTKPVKTKAQLFPFDPNTATEADFMRLGLPSFLAKRILNYREKGGKFRKKEDFAKIYGLRDADFQRLLPYIQVPEPQKKEASKMAYPKAFPPKTTFPPIDLNLADTADLKRVNGIGSVLAARIVKYRNKLGGFAKPEQLYEVYGLDSAVVRLTLTKFVSPNAQGLKHLAINILPADSLAKHPYIGRKAAKILVNYRTQHGNFHTKEDLLKSKALEVDKAERLAPYLEF